jgi:Tol biopolymer transport system component
MRFTFDPKDDFNPVWSPDGTHIAFTSDRKGVRDIYVKQSNGIGAEELLVTSASHKNSEDWSPDGKLVLYNTGATGIWAAPIGGGRQPFPIVQGPGYPDQGRVSPDGKWIAYRSSESGREQVYVQSFPAAGAKLQISTEGGWEPSWRRDGRELYYTIHNKLMAVDVKATAGKFDYSAPKMLFEGPFVLDVRRNRYTAAVDGQRFLIVTAAEEGTPSPIHIVLNWKSALAK